jgi:hypothetical protein
MNFLGPYKKQYPGYKILTWKILVTGFFTYIVFFRMHISLCVLTSWATKKDHSTVNNFKTDIKVTDI